MSDAATVEVGRSKDISEMCHKLFLDLCDVAMQRNGITMSDLSRAAGFNRDYVCQVRSKPTYVPGFAAYAMVADIAGYQITFTAKDGATCSE